MPKVAEGSLVLSNLLRITKLNVPSYFDAFASATDCGLNAIDLYIPPNSDKKGPLTRAVFCPSRDKLLHAMGEGGRIGFDAPYVPQGMSVLNPELLFQVTPVRRR